MSFTIPNEIEVRSEITSAEHEQNYSAIETDLNTEVIRRDGSVAMSAELQLAGDPATPNGAATKQYVDDSLPLGVALPFFGSSAPVGSAFPIGQSLARATYPELAAVIAPDSGSLLWVNASTFKLPDMRGRSPFGLDTNAATNQLAETAGSRDAVIVSHDHTQAAHNHDLPGQWLQDGSANASGTVADPDYPGKNTVTSPTTDSKTPTINPAGESGTGKNLHPVVVCNWIMRLA